MSDPYLLGSAWRLVPPERVGAGPAGQRLGRRAGSSLEFHEHRAYQAGDDLRHLDWRAFARTGSLHTRLHREEVASTVEIVLDASRSMALTPAKAAGLRALTAFLAGAAAGEHAVRAVAAQDSPLELPTPMLRDLDAALLPLASARALPDLPLAGLLRPGTLRIVLSDFLFPHSPAAIARIARGAGRTLCVQLLDPEDAAPELRGALRLRDVESGAERELQVDAASAARYRRRLERLSEDLALALQQHDGALVRAVAGQDTVGAGLSAWARGSLAPAGWLEER